MNYTKSNIFDSIDLQKLVKLYIKLSSRVASYPPTDAFAIPKHLRDLLTKFESAQKKFIRMVMRFETMTMKSTTMMTTDTHNSSFNQVDLMSSLMMMTTSQPLDSMKPNQLSKLTLLSLKIVASHPQALKEVSDYLDKQGEIFIHGISKYMRNHDNSIGHYGRRKKEEETGNIEIIIETCPEFLSFKMKCGFYPIHCALFDHKVSKTVPLLAKAAFDKGLQNRGFILEEVRGLNLFHFLTAHASRVSQRNKPNQENEYIATFKALMTYEPPLFTRKDVIDYDLLHHAVIANSQLAVEFFAELCPEALYKWKKCRGSTESLDMLPVALSPDASMMELVLNHTIKADPNNESIGGLFHKNEKGTHVIQYIIDNLGREITWRTLHKVLAQWKKDFHILHKVIVDVPKELDMALTTFAHSYHLRDKNGRLPIHTALAKGMKWSLPLLFLINAANLQNIAQSDPVTGLCPIALAALEPSSDLDTIYYLMQSFPEEMKGSLP